MSADKPNPFSDPFNDPKPNSFGPNSYQKPDFTDKPPYPSGNNQLSPAILTQQRMVAIMMIVQGVMSSVWGLVLVGMALVIPIAAEIDQRNNDGDPSTGAHWIVMGIYGSLGLCNLIPGVFQIYAGIQGLWLRSYILGIIALGSGTLTAAGFCCFITSLALFIYGLFIYLHYTTRRAFELAKDGRTFDEIMRMAAERRY